MSAMNGVMDRVSGDWMRGGVFAMLLLAVVVGAVAVPEFGTANNLINVLRSIALIGVASLGMGFVVLVGSLVDLSIPAAISIAAVVLLTFSGSSLLLGIVLALAAAAILGLVNGDLIRRYDANPILLTLATNTIALGLLLIATGSRVTYGQDPALTEAINARVVNLPVPVLILLGLTIVCQVAVTRTTWGRRLLAVGANEHTAEFAGLAPGKMRLQAFLLAAVFAGITGVLLGGGLGSAAPSAGAGYEFDALTATIIGGCKLDGGKGSPFGILAGAVLVGVLSNLLILVGAPFSTQQILKGVLLVAVVGLSRIGGADS